MQEQLTANYVLHMRPFRETSQIVELLTRDEGRLAAVARGVRGRSGSRGRRGALAAPRQFVPALARWIGRGPLFTLTAWEPAVAGPAPVLAGERLAGGLYMNELLVRMLKPADGHPALYDDYALTLAALESEAALPPLLRRFEHRLLLDCGYAPDFRATVTGDGVLPDRRYRLHGDEGFARDDDAGAFPGSALLAIAADDYSQATTRRHALTIFRALLAPHLGNRPLKSRELLHR
ncbi:MAG: DNA repair protein RecO [Pseudomonadota bacterium]